MKTVQKKILILSFTESSRAPRVYRQIVFLKDVYNLVVAGYGALHIENVKFCPLFEPPPQHILDRVLTRTTRIFRLKTGRFEEYYWSQPNVQDAFRKLQSETFDLIIAHDLYTLPLALSLAKQRDAKVLLDAHEYTPREFEEHWRFRLLYQPYWDYICRTYLSQAHGMVTVCQGIAEEYANVYGVSSQVLTNATFYEELAPSPVLPGTIRMIYHGGFHPSRKIENMVALMKQLDSRFHLDVILAGDVAGYSRYLRRLCYLARQCQRIQFCEPVPMLKITQKLNHYDIGLYLLSPEGFNNQRALPNKFFEWVQARLAVAIWPSPEMACIVREHDCGVIADDFTIEAMAARLNALSSDEIQHYKAQSHKAARLLCAEANRQILLDLVTDLIGK